MPLSKLLILYFLILNWSEIGNIKLSHMNFNAANLLNKLEQQNVFCNDFEVHVHNFNMLFTEFLIIYTRDIEITYELKNQ